MLITQYLFLTAGKKLFIRAIRLSLTFSSFPDFSSVSKDKKSIEKQKKFSQYDISLRIKLLCFSKNLRRFIMTGAVVYARYSSERQTEQSIEGQLHKCYEYAKINGLTILETYIDRAMTGTNDKRTAFQQMLADSEKKTSWNVVLVYAIDRFGRNSIEVAINKQKLKKNGKILISATQRTSENIDGTKNLDGILLENVYIGLAEYYSAELSQKIIRGQYESLNKGNYIGGIVPFGYRVENKKIFIDEERAKIVREIFNEYVNGKTVPEIVDSLTDKGILYKGKPFVLNTVYKMLKSKRYAGIYYYKDKFYDNIYPPIISQELFTKIQIISKENKLGKTGKEEKFLLRNKLICGYCGKSIQGESGTSHTGKVMHYYKCMGRKRTHDCNKKIDRKDTLENLVINTTLQILNKPETISFIAEQVIRQHKEKNESDSLIKILSEQKSSATKSLSNILKAIEAGIINETTKNRMEELEQTIAQLNEKIIIEKAKAENYLTKEEICYFIPNAIKKNPESMIRILIKQVVVYDDKIEIFLQLYKQKSRRQRSGFYFD